MGPTRDKLATPGKTGRGPINKLSKSALTVFDPYHSCAGT